MTKSLSVTDYCLHCQNTRVLIRYDYVGMSQWVCATCGAIVDSDFYDDDENYEEDEEW